MIEVTYTVEEKPDRTTVKWSDVWAGTVWNFDGTIVVVLGPGCEDWQARCFIVHDDSGHDMDLDEPNPDDWACSWFTNRGVRLG